MGKMISHDPVTKTTKTFHKGQRDGEEFYISTEQDVTDIIEKSKHRYNSFRGAWEKHGEWGDKYAEIPASVWGDLIKSGIANDEKRLRKWLDDRDQLAFRQRPGRLSK